jgi:L-asparaginase
MSEVVKKIVIIGTGGTIAGNAASKKELVNYSAGEKKAAELLFGIPVPKNIEIETIELCQIDSKDMTFAILKKMAVILNDLMDRDDVAGVVITHGTDTLEETGIFLNYTVVPTKPIVLTASMRPSTALSADGPLNLLDSIMLASSNHIGIFALINNTIYLAEEIIKSHTLKVDGFYAGDFGAIGHVYNSEVEFFRNVKHDQKMNVSLEKLPNEDKSYPWVEIIYSDVSANGQLISLLVDNGVDGFIINGTGNGTVHQNILNALKAADKTVPTAVTTRVPTGKIMNDQYGLMTSPYSHAAKARMWLTLWLLNSR